jgi:XTP/dITP diphosphohydrolase
MKLLLATQNHGKQQEWCALLSQLSISLVFPESIGLEMDVEESGETYSENAYLKALAYAIASGLPALADDSGLEVDALEGAPGIRSARYRLGSDKVRYRSLLAALENIPASNRHARFRCVAVLVVPGGEHYETEGVCEGSITFAPAGALGFGYDPVFFVPEYQLTMAQLPLEVKNQISHRARAAREMLAVLARVFDLKDNVGRILFE